MKNVIVFEKKMIKNVVISFIILLFYSCSDKEIINDVNKLSNIYRGNNLKYQFFFPDTVILGKSYNGEIRYKSSFDSITRSFEDDKKIRYISYSFLITKDINYDEITLNKKKKDTFGAIDNNTIPFYDIKFKSIGINYIDGIIYDYVIIDTFKNDTARYIEKKVRATHKVIVIAPDRSDLSPQR